MPDTKADYEVMMGRRLCTREDLHYPVPDVGELGFSAWAMKMSDTHRQKKCPACGLWKIWEPRDA